MLPILIHNKKGIAVVEILIVVGIIAITISSLLSVVVFSLKLSASVKETTTADALAQEMVEAVRNFRDGTDWDSNGLGVLNTGTVYYPEKSGDTPPRWMFTAGEEKFLEIQVLTILKMFITLATMTLTLGKLLQLFLGKVRK